MEAQSLRYPDVHLLPWLQPACVVHTCTLWSYIQAVTGTDLTEPDLNIVLNFFFFFLEPGPACDARGIIALMCLLSAGVGVLK